MLQEAVSCHNQIPSVVEALLQHGAKADDTTGQTGVLHLAVQRHSTVDPRILTLLIRAGANVNLKGQFNETALLYAANRPAPQMPVLKLLVSAGASLDARDNQGHGLMSYAVQNSHYDIIPTLLSLGADIDERDQAGRPNAVNERGVATDKGLGYLCEFIAAIRDVIGWSAPLAADHFGPLNVNDAIRYAKAFEPYQLAWAEDLLQTREGPHYPWQNWRGYKTISEATSTPVNTGEDIFALEDGFRPLIDNHAVDVIHPDIETAGGLLETKRIADYAEEADIQVAMHHAGSPIGGFAGYHCAATFGDHFLAMENHALDMPWWQDLVTGVAKPIIDKGYVAVPEKPGLGLELNDAVVKEHLRRPGTSSRRRCSTIRWYRDSASADRGRISTKPANGATA